MQSSIRQSQEHEIIAKLAEALDIHTQADGEHYSIDVERRITQLRESLRTKEVEADSIKKLERKGFDQLSSLRAHSVRIKELSGEQRSYDDEFRALFDIVHSLGNTLALNVSTIEDQPYLTVKTKLGKALFANFEQQSFSVHGNVFPLADRKRQHVDTALTYENATTADVAFTAWAESVAGQLAGDSIQINQDLLFAVWRLHLLSQIQSSAPELLWTRTCTWPGVFSFDRSILPKEEAE